MASNLKAILHHPGVRWIAGGWTFFIAENIIVTENREFLIHDVFKSERTYLGLFATLSTAATASIAWGYFKHGRNQGPILWTPKRVPAFLCLTLGWGIVGNMFPALQSPGKFLRAWGSSDPSQMRNRCPLDLSFDGNEKPGMTGLKRISRNAPLWGFGFLCLGKALLTPHATGVVCFSFPLLFALLGGAHKDSRLYRNGSYSAEDMQQSSNIPFLAL